MAHMVFQEKVRRSLRKRAAAIPTCGLPPDLGRDVSWLSGHGNGFKP